MSLWGNADSAAITGNVDVTNGSATVGEGSSSTAFTTAGQIDIGDLMMIVDVPYRVKSIETAASLTLTTNYAGSTATNLTVLKRETPRNLSVADSDAIFGISTTANADEHVAGADNITSIAVDSAGTGYVNAADAAVTVAAPTVRTIATSAVTTSSNSITIAAHNILTGSALTYQDGSGTVLTGLADNTKYYAIKIDNDTIKLGSSLANAQAGTAIALSGTGNNAQTLEGTQATATSTVTLGKVTGITITEVGSDYQSVPTVTIAAADNQTFNANVVSSANDTIALSSDEVTALAVNDAVTYTNGGGSEDIGLTTATVYYIHSKPSATTVTLKTSVDSQDAINLTVGSSETGHGLQGATGSATASRGSGSGTNVVHPGWVKRTVGTGGRAGRVHYETLVAMSSITGDTADDTEFPE